MTCSLREKSFRTRFRSGCVLSLPARLDDIDEARTRRTSSRKPSPSPSSPSKPSSPSPPAKQPRCTPSWATLTRSSRPTDGSPVPLLEPEDSLLRRCSSRLDRRERRRTGSRPCSSSRSLWSLSRVRPFLLLTCSLPSSLLFLPLSSIPNPTPLPFPPLPTKADPPHSTGSVVRGSFTCSKNPENSRELIVEMTWTVSGSKGESALKAQVWKVR